MQNKSQADTITTNKCDKNAVKALFNIVGEPSTTSYFQIANALQCDISKRLNLKKIHFYSSSQLLNFGIELCLMKSNHSKTAISKSETPAKKYVRFYDFDKCLELLENKEFITGQLKKNAKQNH